MSQHHGARPDISVIIPSYNCGDLVGLAVESAYAFSSRSLEVIVVDDGSTDNSRDILTQLRNRYPELNVIHQTNGGLSNARNSGIRRAMGRFVVLLDADDQLLPMGGLSELDTNVDMVRMGVEEVGMDGVVSLHVEPLNQLAGPDYLAMHFKDDSFYPPSWAYIYRLDWLRSRALAFVDGLIHEDTLFTVEALLCCERLLVVETLGYRYFRRAGSITKNVSYGHMRKRVDSLSRICIQLTAHSHAHPRIDLGWWTLNMIDYAATLAKQTRSRRLRWTVLQMEVRYFMVNKVWRPWRTRDAIRFRLRKRFEDWLFLT